MASVKWKANITRCWITDALRSHFHGSYVQSQGYAGPAAAFPYRICRRPWSHFQWAVNIASRPGARWVPAQCWKRTYHNYGSRNTGTEAFCCIYSHWIGLLQHKKHNYRQIKSVFRMNWNTDWIDALQCQRTFQPRQEYLLGDHLIADKKNGIQIHHSQEIEIVSIGLEIVEHLGMGSCWNRGWWVPAQNTVSSGGQPLLQWAQRSVHLPGMILSKCRRIETHIVFDEEDLPVTQQSIPDQYRTKRMHSLVFHKWWKHW